MARKDVYCCDCQSQPCHCLAQGGVMIIIVGIISLAVYGVYKLFS